MSLLLQRIGGATCIAATCVVLSASTVHAQGALNREANSFQTFNCSSEASLQTQILTARDGATIFPGSGPCEGPFVISERDVNIRGFGSTRSTLTAAEGSTCVVTIAFATVKISRIDIDATGADHGICVGTGSSLRTFDDVVIKNANKSGLLLSNGASAEFSDSSAKDNIGAGIGVDSGAHASVLQSEISGNGADGVRVHGAASASFADSDIIGNGGAGVLVDFNSAVELKEASLIENNGMGGVRCGLTGAVIVGAVQDYGSMGNPSGDAVLATGCQVSNAPSDSAFPPTSTTFPPP